MANDIKTQAAVLADEFDNAAHQLRTIGTFSEELATKYCAAAFATAALLRADPSPANLMLATHSMHFFAGLLEENKHANRSPLTQLPNRRAFDEELNKTVFLIQRNGHHNHHAILYFDADRFKTVNDTLGHAGGDAAIKEIARELDDIARLEERVYHWGGDEFAVLLIDQTSTSPDEAATHFENAAARFRQKFESKIFEYNGQKVPLTASFGFHVIKMEDFTGRETAEELKDKIKAFGDKALYADKNNNRDRRQAHAWSLIANANAEPDPPAPG